MTKVTVVIPCLYHVDGEYLKLAVESLRATTDWDIIVVTNGSTNKPDLKHIRGITNHIHTPKQGQCLAVNYGAQAANPTTDYIFISNADMYYAPDWDKNLRFDDPVFSPNLVEPENNLGSAAPFRKLGAGFTLDEFDKTLVDTYIKDVVYALEGKENVEDGLNFPLFVKKDLWGLLKGYDVAYDPWGSNSDTDLQTRINLAGVTPKRLTDVLVYHFSNKSGTFAPENDAFRMNNFEYFRDKFGFDRDELGSDVWYNKDMIPKDKEKIKYAQKPYTA